MKTLTQIIQDLETLPSRIARQSEVAENKRDEWDRYEAELKYLEASKYLELKAKNTGTSATELKVMVSHEDDIYAKKMDCIGAETNCKKEQAKVDELDNMFTGSKVIARIKMTEMKSIGSEVKDEF